MTKREALLQDLTELVIGQLVRPESCLQEAACPSPPCPCAQRIAETMLALAEAHDPELRQRLSTRL